MAVFFHQATAGLYLAATIAAWLGIGLRSTGLERSSVRLLFAGALCHVAAFSLLHTLENPPPLTDLAAATSFMACAGTLFFLALQRGLRLAGLATLVAPLAFAAVFAAALRLPSALPAVTGGAGSWPHAHVLLAGAGLALLGVSALAGVLFLAEHRRLKARRPLDARLPLPTLEALDRTNRVALALGFPLLTLGVAAGALWADAVRGRLWSGTEHETWTLVAWALYAVLVGARFGARQGSRQAAVSAVGGFVFLCFAVIGVELFA